LRSALPDVCPWRIDSNKKHYAPHVLRSISSNSIVD
jgi:hypothetical protein